MATIAVIVGSLRKESINLKLAKALIKLSAELPEKPQFKLVSIADLPLHNEDLWQDPPAAILKFKDEIKAADAVLIVSPEHNRSVTAPLKNALDWASRPNKESVWPNKPVAIVGSSPGKIGTAVAQSQLRVILLALNMRVLPQPEIYFQHQDDMFTEQHDITNPKTHDYLKGFLESFLEWIKLTKD